MSPTTGTPSIERPCLRWSSSTMTTGTRSASWWRRISRTIVAPASPAPTMATRVADRVSGGGGAAAPQPALEPDGAHHHRGDERAEQRHRAWHRQGPGRVDQEDDGPGRGAGEDDAPRLGDAGVLPDLAVQPPRQVGAELHEDDDREEREQPVLVLRRDVAVEPNGQQHQERACDEHHVNEREREVAAQSAHEPSPNCPAHRFSPQLAHERARNLSFERARDTLIQFSAVRSFSLSAHLVVPA